MKMINKINWQCFEDIEDKAKYDCLEEIGQEVIDKVKEKVPVKSGNLLVNTYFIAEEGHLIFKADTPYAEAVNQNVNFMEDVEIADYEEMIAERLRGYLND